MKTILVTGSSRGIGRAIAKKAASQGYQVILHGKTESENLSRLADQITGSKKVVFDVADEQAVQQALSKISRIDVLVNNAGVALGRTNSIEDIYDDIALREYSVNVLGAVHCIKAIVPKMIAEDGGSIINISSIKGRPNLATLSTITYAQSKTALISLTKAFAKELAKNNIRVNCVLPGYTKTEASDAWPESTIQRAIKGTLLKRLATPQDIAGAVMFLASDDANFITGTELLVDGGYEIAGK